MHFLLLPSSEFFRYDSDVVTVEFCMFSQQIMDIKVGLGTPSRCYILITTAQGCGVNLFRSIFSRLWEPLLPIQCFTLWPEGYPEGLLWLRVS